MRRRERKQRDIMTQMKKDMGQKSLLTGLTAYKEIRNMQKRIVTLCCKSKSKQKQKATNTSWNFLRATSSQLKTWKVINYECLALVQAYSTNSFNLIQLVSIHPRFTLGLFTFLSFCILIFLLRPCLSGCPLASPWHLFFFFPFQT